MGSARTDTFYLDIGWHRAWVLVLPTVVVLFLEWPRYTAALIVMAQIVLFVVILVLLGTVSVRDRGLVLYRINHLAWSNIKEVSQSTVFGLPYLKIKKARGVAGWWLPLYLRNISGFYVSVAARAPIGNPLRTFAESAYTQQRAPRNVGASAPPPLN